MCSVSKFFVLISVFHGVSGELPFVSLGDWGQTGPSLTKTARAVALASARGTALSHVVALGDNFYSFGVNSLTDQHWNKTFERVFTHRELQLPWFAILGNHDWFGSAQSQIEMFRSGGAPRWVMPNYYYFTLHVFPEEQMSVPLRTILATVYIDTWTIILPLLSGIGDSQRQLQLKWLEQILPSLRQMSDWVVVAGHHPVYSSGSHGDTEAIKKYVLPLMRKFGVDMYLSGHDHHLEALVDDPDDYEPGVIRERPILFIISGAAAKSRELGGRHPLSRFATSDFGFTHHVVRKNSLRTDFIDDTVLSRHTEILHKKRKRILRKLDDYNSDKAAGWAIRGVTCKPEISTYTVVGINDVPNHEDLMILINNANNSQNAWLTKVPNSCMLAWNSSDLDAPYVPEGSLKIYGRPAHAYLPLLFLVIGGILATAGAFWIIKGWMKHRIWDSQIPSSRTIRYRRSSSRTDYL